MLKQAISRVLFLVSVAICEVTVIHLSSILLLR